MTSLFAAEDGNTELSVDEQAELIPSLASRQELNEWERQNIVEAYAWATHRRNLRRLDPLAETYVRELHRRMFDQTWKWAGRYRLTEKNIGVPFYRIQEQLFALLGDCQYWITHSTFAPDEIAIRFHHRLVFIHPFANGNGRHSRLMADVLALRLGRPVFSWGAAELVAAGDFRRTYISALRAADKHDLTLLLKFARS